MRLWYFAAHREESGPILESDLVQLLVQDQLREKTLVWTEGLEDWQPASNFDIFPPAHEEGVAPAAEDSWEEDWQEDLSSCLP